MSIKTNLCPYNITSKATLNYGNEIMILNKMLFPKLDTCKCVPLLFKQMMKLRTNRTMMDRLRSSQDSSLLMTVIKHMIIA
jgi:hypothetical protein